MIAQYHYKIDQVKFFEKYHFHDHGLSPLPMQNPYSKFILAIKTLSADRFSNFLQVLLGQTMIKKRKLSSEASFLNFSEKIYYVRKV